MAQTETSEALFGSHQPFEALLEAMKAGIALKNEAAVNPNQSFSDDLVVTALQQAVFWIRERNRLDAHEGIIWDTTVSNDGQMIASASADGSARVWHTDGIQLDRFDFKDTQVLSVAFSPNGQHLAVGLENSQIQIWQLGKQRGLLTTLNGHEGPVTSLAFSPNGQKLASASEDKTVRLWKQYCYGVWM